MRRINHRFTTIKSLGIDDPLEVPLVGDMREENRRAAALNDGQRRMKRQRPTRWRRCAPPSARRLARPSSPSPSLAPSTLHCEHICAFETKDQLAQTEGAASRIIK